MNWRIGPDEGSAEQVELERRNRSYAIRSCSTRSLQLAVRTSVPVPKDSRVASPSVAEDRGQSLVLVVQIRVVGNEKQGPGAVPRDRGASPARRFTRHMVVSRRAYIVQVAIAVSLQTNSRPRSKFHLPQIIPTNAAVPLLVNEIRKKSALMKQLSGGCSPNGGIEKERYRRRRFSAVLFGLAQPPARLVADKRRLLWHLVFHDHVEQKPFSSDGPQLRSVSLSQRENRPQSNDEPAMPTLPVQPALKRTRSGRAATAQPKSDKDKDQLRKLPHPPKHQGRVSMAAPPTSVLAPTSTADVNDEVDPLDTVDVDDLHEDGVVARVPPKPAQSRRDCDGGQGRGGRRNIGARLAEQEGEGGGGGCSSDGAAAGDPHTHENLNDNTRRTRERARFQDKEEVTHETILAWDN
ncbi:hypothetical protein C8R43DRAFT_1111202 [Mycena crocata]|nr:hypothetical protein C8R43DRAFT_1111202 [Mycena crocata]